MLLRCSDITLATYLGRQTEFEVIQHNNFGYEINFVIYYLCGNNIWML